MAKRQKEWARRTRDKLLSALGAKCNSCGSRSFLEFDCMEPRGDYHHKLSWDQRMSFYRREFAANNLQVLCESCHNKKSATELYWQETLFAQENPF